MMKILCHLIKLIEYNRFTPPSGKIKLGRAKNAINDFINECFNSMENKRKRLS